MNESSHLEEAPVPDRRNAPLSAWERGEMPEPPPGFEWSHDHLRKSVRLTDIYSENRKEKQYFAKVMGEATEEETAAVNPSRQDWLLSELQQFLASLAVKLSVQAGTSKASSLDSNPRPRIRPVRPPRSEFPLAAGRPAELLRAKFAKGRLYFSCPCCRFPAALPVRLAGKRARCPRCYSAIRAPHPRRGLNTRILENDIESIVHPERFEDYRGAHRLIPFLGIRRPAFQPTFHAAGIAILATVILLFIPAMLQNVSRKPAAAEFVASGVRPVDSGYKERALRLVEKFLAAGSVAAKAGFVLEPQRVAPLMLEWYERHPGQDHVTPESMEITGTSSAIEPLATDVRIAASDGTEALFTVEHRPDGDCIDWESSVGYNPDFASLMTGADGGKPRVIRVLATFDDYFNYSFPHSDSHLCVRLHDPSTLELLGHGYIPADVDSAGPLATALAGSSLEDLRPLTLEVQPAADAATTRQVTILRTLEAGGRTGETASAF